MVGEPGTDDFAAGDAEGRGNEDEIEQAGGERRGEGAAGARLEVVGAEAGEVGEEAGGGVGGFAGGVEITADERGHTPERGAGVVAFFEVAEDLGDLGEARGAGAVVEVEVEEGEAEAADGDFGEEKAFFSDGAAAEGEGFAFFEGVAG